MLRGGFQKTTLKNIFRGCLFKTPQKVMKIELLEAIVQKWPPKVKFSWILGVVKKLPWLTHLGVVVLQPPKAMRIELLEVVVKKCLHKLNSHDFLGGDYQKNSLENTFRGDHLRTPPPLTPPQRKQSWELNF